MKKSPAAISRTAVRSLGHERAAQRQDRCGKIRRGVGVRQRAADRAAVANLGIAHLSRYMPQQGALGRQQVAGLQRTVPSQRTYGDVVAAVVDVAEVGHAADVDDHAGHRQAQLHHRQQGVAARQQLGLVAVLAEQSDGLGGGTRPFVVECCRNHCCAPLRPTSRRPRRPAPT